MNTLTSLTYRASRPAGGFTLLELAIVLLVLALIIWAVIGHETA